MLLPPGLYFKNTDDKTWRYSEEHLSSPQISLLCSARVCSHVSERDARVVKQRRANVEHRLYSWSKIKVHINRPTPFLQHGAGGGALSFFLDPGRQFLKHMHSHALTCTPPNHRKEKLALRQTQRQAHLYSTVFSHTKNVYCRINVQREQRTLNVVE